MSLAASLSPHIPYLRRFARTATGTQKSGDAYVSAVLEALIADVSLFPKDVDPRVGLYAVFASMWQSVTLNTEADEDSSEIPGGVAKNLNAIAPLPRQAFLLIAVEGFSPDEGATILGVSPEKFSEYLDQAGSEIAEQVATDILIIEDEPLIALDIQELVEGLGHRVTGIARTHKEAISLFASDQPGMVLADIQLADGSSGIDAVNEILKMVDVPVIFITAFPERLLTGERPEPAFLVTKPFQPEMVKALISQALFFDDGVGREKVA